jgi:hypothetical protein
MTIDPAVLVLLSALLSAGSAIVATYLTNRHNLRVTRLTKESEERKHQKELIFNAALENWKQAKDVIQAKGGGPWDALDVYLIHMLAFSDVLFDPTTSPENLKQRLNEAHRLVLIARETTYERAIGKREQ